MKTKHLALLGVSGLMLASCSFAINFSSISSSKSSSAQQTSYPPSGLTRTKIRQTYSDYVGNNIYPIGSAPTLGNCKLLVIPAWFTDSYNYLSTSHKDDVRSDIQTAYFGTTEQTGWHSVKTYYETESLGRINISGTVSEWYNVSAASSSYAADTVATRVKTASLVTAATNWYFSNHPEESRKDYDADQDGYIDGVMMIYAAPDYSTSGLGGGNLWAYCNWVQDHAAKDATNPGVNQFFWASFDFMYGSNTALSRTGKTYAGGDTNHCKLDTHTFIHEMGHVFGLDDYYDYGPNKYSPAGKFSMQDYNIGGHDAYSALAMGWADPYIPHDSCAITINAFQKNRDCILLSPEWNSFDSAFDEYLLLELYTPTGLNAFDTTHAYSNNFPKGPEAIGIRLWHVDARLLYVDHDQLFTPSQITTDVTYDSYYGVVQAFSNTSDDDDYGTPLGKEPIDGVNYDQFNLLQLIHNNTSVNYLNMNALRSSDLFRDGDSFSMSAYGKQFIKSGRLNSGKLLGWSFTVHVSGSGDDATATVVLTKE